MAAQTIHSLVIYPRPHVDTICAIFLLREFGEQLFPGVGEAKIEYWNRVPDGKTADQLEQEGVLLIDMGGGKFDHHPEEHGAAKNDCASTLVAKHLGVDNRPELARLLAYVKRDDLYGRGIVSKDVIDRAFGLSAIVMNLNRDYPDYPDYVIDIISRIFLAHYHEEYRRKVLLPQEWQRVQKTGKAVRFNVPTTRRILHVVLLESDSPALVGFLRAIREVQADIIVQRRSSGHTNVVTRQHKPRLDLRQLVARVRQGEAAKKQLGLENVLAADLTRPGRYSGIDEWYYDTAANTLQNGGAAPEGVTPTRLSLDEIRLFIEQSFS